MKTKFWLFLLPLALMYSCGNTGVTLPSVTGTQFEVLVVMNDTAWKDSAGIALDNVLSQYVDGLPQAEPNMDVHHCNQEQFTSVLMPTRNIVLTDIAEKYSAPKITYGKDRWAAPQAFVKITAPSDTAFARIIKEKGQEILNFFIVMERERQMYFNKDYLDAKDQTAIEKMFGIQIDIPQGISKATVKKDFYWLTNDNPTIREDIVIYSYPYTDKNTFTKDFLIAKRDSVMKANIPGELKGSYMGTELKYADPMFREITVNGGYAAELRGLWRMMNGAAMGGPFYSQTRLDEIHQRVITIEAFVFAPGKNKRNPMRQMEAVVYSAKLPQEINAIKEVSVVAKKENKEK